VEQRAGEVLEKNTETVMAYSYACVYSHILTLFLQSSISITDVWPFAMITRSLKIIK
jgi:hypothetical protein